MSKNKFLKTRFTFGCFTDLHYSKFPIDSPRLKQFLNDCILVFNSSNLNFVVQLGDLILDGFENYDEILPVVQKIRMPTYHVLGNHDFDVLPNKKLKVSTKLKLLNNYYDFFPCKGWRCIILDGSDISLYSSKKDSKKYCKAIKTLNTLKQQNHPSAYDWNGAIGLKQLNWLERTLYQATSKQERILIFCHFPCYPDDEFYSLWNANVLLSYLDKYKSIVAYISGHQHPGFYEKRSNVHFISLKAFSIKNETSSFSIFRVLDDEIIIIGYGAEESRQLQI